MNYLRPLPLAAAAVCLIALPAINVNAADPAAIRPLSTDGRPLNLDFETGDLSDWTASGNAWEKQPIKGDTVSKRRKDMKSGHAGEFWLGGYEVGQDKPTGRLTSATFKVTHPWASFLVGGGDLPGTRVEIVLKDGAKEKVIHTARGAQDEGMARSIVDLQPYKDKDIFIRIIDEAPGHWGHINFDDFVFHAEKPKFAKIAAPRDEVKFAGLSPEEAAKAAELPPGFELRVFAAEPELVNPISFCIDRKGRVWVVEGRTYPHRAKDGEGQDRVLVFEDTDNDGKADKRTVFLEKLNLVSGIEVGFDGVWIGAAPYLMYVPVDESSGSPKPAGEPKILLDGWGYQDTHETLNTFKWGPDGWLYGCHGVFTHSNVGKPGAPDSERQKINAGIWRYHPTKHNFEVFSWGTSNPWGIDFDENGQCFIEACVIPHLFHMIQGARYQRQAGQHFQAHTYEDIQTIADHRHYVGNNPHGGNNRSDSAGGGHAHAGFMIYQAETWPAEFRGRLFMGNIHGQRINVDIAERKGSGFVGKHAPDFINFQDRASQVVDIRQSPDGNAYLMDWYDLNQCHRTQREAHEYEKGRIYKVVAKDKAAAPVTDLDAKSDAELAALVLDKNEWVSRMARLIIQERAAKGTKPDVAALEKAVREAAPREALRALWTLHNSRSLSEGLLAECLNEREGREYITAWAIQAACEEKPAPAVLGQLAKLAANAKSPVTRLYLASAAIRLPVEQRLPLVEPLLAHEADAKDHNLPLMYWWAIEPVVGKDPVAAATLLGKVKIPKIQEFIARRMASTAKAQR